MRSRARLSAFCALGTLVAASAVTAVSGVASATFQSNIASLTTTSLATLSAGSSGEPLPNIQFAVTQSATQSVWLAGDSVTFELWDGTVGNELSNSLSVAQQTASFSSVPSVVANNGIDPSYYNVSLAPGPNSTVNDELVLTFLKPAPQNASTTAFTLGNLRLSLGAGVPAGHAVQLKATAGAGMPFAGSAQIDYLAIGSIPSATVSVSSLATAAPGTSPVALGNVTVRVTAAGVISAGDSVDLTLVDGSFTASGALGGTLSTATLATLTTDTSADDTERVVTTKAAAVGDTLTLTGTHFSMPGSPQEVYLTVMDKTTGVLLGSTDVASAVNVDRIGGADRYATASDLFDSAFSGATVAVVTSGANYPDALSATYLASQLSAGILTTDPASLSAPTLQELVAHGITTVYIVGGTAAVSQAVQDQIAALHVGGNAGDPLIAVTRIAGGDRYATNELVDTNKGPDGSTTALIATGANFADALAVGPAVYRTGDPLILVSDGGLTASATTTINTLGIKSAIIVGGPSAVSPSIETALTALGVQIDYRIAGSDRTETAADIAEWETSGLPAIDQYAALGSLGFSGVGLANIARGDTFADALAAGAVAGVAQSVILLSADPNTVGPGIAQYFAGRAGVIGTVRAIGLAAAVSAATLDGAADDLTQPLLL